jgi:hypothetical protein
MLPCSQSNNGIVQIQPQIVGKMCVTYAKCVGMRHNALTSMYVAIPGIGWRVSEGRREKLFSHTAQETIADTNRLQLPGKLGNNNTRQVHQAKHVYANKQWKWMWYYWYAKTHHQYLFSRTSCVLYVLTAMLLRGRIQFPLDGGSDVCNHSFYFSCYYHTA